MYKKQDNCRLPGFIVPFIGRANYPYEVASDSDYKMSESAIDSLCYRQETAICSLTFVSHEPSGTHENGPVRRVYADAGEPRRCK